MPRLSENTVPSYRLHKQSGQAIVTLDSRDILLGKYNSAASRDEYRRRIGEWIANNRHLPQDDADLTITELVNAFKDHAEAFYGGASGEADNYRLALRPLRKLYGNTRATDFGPLKLEAVRNSMIEMEWTRTHINRQLGRIKMVFKWAVSRELMPASIYHAVATLAGLRVGRSAARESDPVRSVPDELVNTTVKHLSSTIKAMVMLQRYSGARPGEICAMKIGDIERTDDVWTYKPLHHKTKHHGHIRTVYIGPKAQKVLQPYLMNLDAAAFVFSPAKAEADRRVVLHENRETPLSCGNKPGSHRQRKPKRRPGESYSVNAYRRAIARACKLAFHAQQELLSNGKEAALAEWWDTHVWHPNQLRHTAGTDIRRQFGLEAAQHVLGHAQMKVTEIYAEKNADVAMRVAAMVG